MSRKDGINHNKDLREGDYVCLNNMHLMSFDMDHPLWQAIGRIRTKTQYENGAVNFQITWPNSLGVDGYLTELRYTPWDIRRATNGEGHAAFMLDQWEFERKQQEKYDARFEKAKAEQAKANLSISDF